MSRSLVFISGASRGIGLALARTVPWPDSHVLDLSRHGPGQHAPDVEHVAADLADPVSWSGIGRLFAERIGAFDGDRAVFVHCAGTLTPIGFVGEVSGDAYTTNVVLNSAAPQVLGHHFLAAIRDRPDLNSHLWLISSGAASSVYEGWSSYGAGKAAVDHWVRAVGQEQQRRGGCQVVAVAPGVVATAMQEQIRETEERDFPAKDKFVQLHEREQLRDPAEVAAQMWALAEREDLPSGSVLDLRDLPPRPQES
jgi:benzil reductase ((S)-benzoin forming)